MRRRSCFIIAALIAAGCSGSGSGFGNPAPPPPPPKFTTQSMDGVWECEISELISGQQWTVRNLPIVQDTVAVEVGLCTRHERPFPTPSTVLLDPEYLETYVTGAELDWYQNESSQYSVSFGYSSTRENGGLPTVTSVGWRLSLIERGILAGFVLLRVRSRSQGLTEETVRFVRLRRIWSPQ